MRVRRGSNNDINWSVRVSFSKRGWKIRSSSVQMSKCLKAGVDIVGRWSKLQPNPFRNCCCIDSDTLAISPCPTDISKAPDRFSVDDLLRVRVKFVDAVESTASVHACQEFLPSHRRVWVQGETVRVFCLRTPLAWNRCVDGVGCADGTSE